MGKKWTPKAGEFNNCVERLRQGRFRLFDWAAEEFTAWLAMRAEYYRRVQHGIESRNDWANDPKLSATHDYAGHMIDAINDLAGSVPDNFSRDQWSTAATMVNYQPDPEGPEPEVTDGTTSGTR